MFGLAPSRIWLLTLVCVALLFVRLGGAHMHLCFDGGEPPASLHLMDNGLHHVAGTDAFHQDVDLALADEAVAKFVLDLPILPVVLLLVWSLLRIRRPPAPGYHLPPFPSAARFVRPPLRGPPQLIFH